MDDQVTHRDNPAAVLLRKARTGLELVRPKQYILIVSHMRSYSSLLCHILNSNPEVAGYVETHRKYASSVDFLKLRRSVMQTTGGELSGQYVLDKLLHNYASIDRSVLRRDDVHVIFSLREPERTIKSTIEMGRKLETDDWKAYPEKVVRYYVRRMKNLQALAEQEIRHATSIDAELLVDDTPKVLDHLTDFLALSTPLTQEYQTSEYTGKPRYGDPSQYIEKGTIVRKRDDYSHIDVPEEGMTAAWEAYERAMESVKTVQFSRRG